MADENKVPSPDLSSAPAAPAEPIFRSRTSKRSAGLFACIACPIGIVAGVALCFVNSSINPLPVPFVFLLAQELVEGLRRLNSKDAWELTIEEGCLIAQDGQKREAIDLASVARIDLLAGGGLAATLTDGKTARIEPCYAGRADALEAALRQHNPAIEIHHLDLLETFFGSDATPNPIAEAR
jgi:hypothetical protein